jgi:hypothetical protein
LVKGEAQVYAKAERSFDPVLIPRAIKDAGFTARDIVVTAVGTLSKGSDFLKLDVPGVRRFDLVGGTRGGELFGRSDLLGKRVRVTGWLNAGANPARLTVESFQPL